MVVGTGWMGVAVLTNNWVNLNTYDCVDLNGSSGLAMVDGLAVVYGQTRRVYPGRWLDQTNGTGLTKRDSNLT